MIFWFWSIHWLHFTSKLVIITKVTIIYIIVCHFKIECCHCVAQVLWEMLTQEIPYKNMDSPAVMWGVGCNTLCLPIPKTCPDVLRLLLARCFSRESYGRCDNFVVKSVSEFIIYDTIVYQVYCAALNYQSTCTSLSHK